MDKSNPPESFGVFKPVGHTVIAFREEVHLKEAMAALLRLGFANTAIVSYTAQEMAKQAAAEQFAAGPLAGFGYELDLVKTHLALAQQGCCFLVVHAPKGEQAAQVAEIARSMNAQSAQHYGRFMIEEVIDNPAQARPISPIP